MPESGPAEPGQAEPGQAEPGSAENPFEITDPRAMRALAHPARIAMLQHLVIDGPSTATECADVAGLSPSACSYHLRELAKYGFVEEDTGSAADGRHRPWRARVVAISIGNTPDQPDAVKAAGRLLLDSLQARFEEVRSQYLDRQADYPAQWQEIAGMRQDVLHVTADELTELKSKLDGLVSSYRRLNKAERPPGARRVHAIIDFTPWFTPDAGQPDAAGPAGAGPAGAGPAGASPDDK
jgi:predicted ArsR family transcriptional regulator